MTSSSPRSGRQAEDEEVEATFCLAHRRTEGALTTVAWPNISVEYCIPNSTRVGDRIQQRPEQCTDSALSRFGSVRSNAGPQNESRARAANVASGLSALCTPVGDTRRAAIT
eukprot:2882051-Prymnesium_polylepis.2